MFLFGFLPVMLFSVKCKVAYLYAQMVCVPLNVLLTTVEVPLWKYNDAPQSRYDS